MKLRLTTDKDTFIKKLKIIDSIQDKKHITLYFKDVDIPTVAGEFQLLSRSIYREWFYILNCIKQFSNTYQKYGESGLVRNSSIIETLKDVKDYKNLIDTNINHAYMQLHTFYKYACKPTVVRGFTIPDVETYRLYVSDTVECGYMPDLIGLFKIPFHGTNSEYFKLQINLFEFINTLTLKKISFEVSHYFPKEIVARKI